MTTTAPVPTVAPAAPRLRYGAVLAMMAMSFLLVTAEFLPNGVLVEIADSVGVTPVPSGADDQTRVRGRASALLGRWVVVAVGRMG